VKIRITLRVKKIYEQYQYLNINLSNDIIYILTNFLISTTGYEKYKIYKIQRKYEN